MNYSIAQEYHVARSIPINAVDHEGIEGEEFWTDVYYIGTVSGRGDRRVIENFIRKQGRSEDIKQSRLFDL